MREADRHTEGREREWKEERVREIKGGEREREREREREERERERERGGVERGGERD